MTAFQRWLIIALFVAIGTAAYIGSQFRYSQAVGFNGQVVYLLDRLSGEICAQFLNGKRTCSRDYAFNNVKWEDAPDKAPIPPGYELVPPGSTK